MFVDTSGLLAVLDRDDARHKSAAVAWADILRSDEILTTTNYVLVETITLLQHRLGLKAVRFFQEEILPVVGIIWVDAAVHHAAMSVMLAADKKKLSLVDCVSFEAMRLGGISSAFTLDRHFHEQGFTCLPEE
ncbi:MAG: type II toxin-antitoxin system VapC family toxin [Desulfobulbaceae bacterium]